MKEVLLSSKGINYPCRIGTNAKDNWYVLSISESHSLFFHLTSFPSCYVIVDCLGFDEVDPAIIYQAANVCKANTKYRFLNDVKVDYTRCDNLEMGIKVGEVIYKSSRKVKTIKL